MSRNAKKQIPQKHKCIWQQKALENYETFFVDNGLNSNTIMLTEKKSILTDDKEISDITKKFQKI